MLTRDARKRVLTMAAPREPQHSLGKARSEPPKNGPPVDGSDQPLAGGAHPRVDRCRHMGEGGTDRLLRIGDVAERTALARSTIYRKLSEGEFPQAVDVGGGVRWRESDIDAWINSRPYRRVA